MAGTSGGKVMVLSSEDLAKQNQLKDEQVNKSSYYTMTLNKFSIKRMQHQLWLLLPRQTVDVFMWHMKMEPSKFGMVS